MIPEQRGGWSRMMMGLVMVVVTMAVIEVLSFFVVRYLSGKGLIFYAPDAASVDYERYMRTRDPDTGWPFRENAVGSDATGARTSPSNAESRGGTPCVSVYGDSFAWSTGVDDSHAWPNLLSQKLGCRVLNFGVIGFGTDQALIRFETNVHDDAPLSMLCFWTEDILRNVNQYRALLSPRAETLLKPRFIHEKGQLTRVALPTLEKREFFRMIDTPEAFLHHEYFLPNTHNFTIRPQFPYVVSCLKALFSKRVASRVNGKLFYEEFFDKTHDSDAYLVTLDIMKRFARECAARNKTPLIVFIPGCRDIKSRIDGGTWIYESMMRDLERESIRVLNTGEIFLRHTGDTDPCALFRDVTLHYNEAGYALIAESVYDFIAANKLVSGNVRQPAAP